MTTLTARLEAFSNIDIYPVISSEFTNDREPLEVLKAIAEGGARIVQLREKSYSKKRLYDLAVEYRRVTNEYGMLLIINDHVDVALAVNADGVHLGQDDLPVAVAKAIAPELIIGSSTHSQQEVDDAVQDGADYINIGPIYATQTKKLVESTTGIGHDLLTQVAPGLPIPFTVMGGIKEHHIAELLALGASKIAMVTEITRADDITATVQKLRAAFS